MGQILKRPTSLERSRLWR